MHGRSVACRVVKRRPSKLKKIEEDTLKDMLAKLRTERQRRFCVNFIGDIVRRKEQGCALISRQADGKETLLPVPMAGLSHQKEPTSLCFCHEPKEDRVFPKTQSELEEWFHRLYDWLPVLDGMQMILLGTKPFDAKVVEKLWYGVHEPLPDEIVLTASKIVESGVLGRIFRQRHG